MDSFSIDPAKLKIVIVLDSSASTIKFPFDPYIFIPEISVVSDTALSSPELVVTPLRVIFLSGASPPLIVSTSLNSPSSVGVNVITISELAIPNVPVIVVLSMLKRFLL